MTDNRSCNCVGGATLRALKELWKKDIACDIIFKGMEGTKIKFHGTLLLANSAFFREKYITGQYDRLYMFPNTKTDTLLTVVRHLYGEELFLSQQDVTDVLQMADTFGFPALASQCRSFQKESLTSSVEELNADTEPEECTERLADSEMCHELDLMEDVVEADSMEDAEDSNYEDPASPLDLSVRRGVCDPVITMPDSCESPARSKDARAKGRLGYLDILGNESSAKEKIVGLRTEKTVCASDPATVCSDSCDGHFYCRENIFDVMNCYSSTSTADHLHSGKSIKSEPTDADDVFSVSSTISQEHEEDMDSDPNKHEEEYQLDAMKEQLCQRLQILTDQREGIASTYQITNMSDEENQVCSCDKDEEGTDELEEASEITYREDTPTALQGIQDRSPVSAGGYHTGSINDPTTGVHYEQQYAISSKANKTNTCAVCQKSFKSRRHLEKHQLKRNHRAGQIRHNRDASQVSYAECAENQIRIPKFTLKQNLCKTRFPRAMNGNSSVQEQQSPTPYVRRGSKKEVRCVPCNRTFKSELMLSMHNTTHSNLAPHICPHCGRAFKHEVWLKSHITRTHRTFTDKSARPLRFGERNEEAPVSVCDGSVVH